MEFFRSKYFLPLAPAETNITGENRRSYLVYFLCWVWAFIITVLFSTRVLLNHDFLVHDSVIALSMYIAFGYALFINKKGHSLTAAYVFVGTCIIITSLASFVSGGVTTPAMMTYPPTIFASGILLGKRGGIVTALISVFITLVMLVLQLNHLLPVTPLFKNPVSYWLGFMAAATVMSVLQYIVNQQTNLAFDKIARQEERYHSLIDHASDPILLLDMDAVIIEVNTSACNVLGYTRDELLSMKLADVFTPEDLEKRPMQIEYLLKHKKLLTERQWRTKDGRVLDMEVHTKELEGQGYLSIARDITQRKLIEEKLRESELKYRNIFENAINVFFQTKMDGTILEVSPSVKDHLGYTREELLGTNVGDIYYDVSQRDDLISQLKENEEIKDYEVKFRAKGGGLVYISASVRLIYKPDGSPGHVDGVFNSITEHKLAEIKLRQSEEKHRVLTENLSDAIILIDKNAKIVYQSAAVKRIGGYGPAELRNKIIFDIVDPEDVQRSKDLFAKAQSAPGVPLPHQYRFRHKDGRYVWIEGTITNLLDFESVKAYIVNYHNITERVKYLDDIEAQNKKLREIAWIQSHVVRAPLARMMGLVNVLREIDMHSAEFEEWVGYFNITADELDAVVHDISLKAKDIPVDQ